MLKPRALAPGDRIAVVAPASSFDRGQFDRGVEELRRLGFAPVYDESVFERRLYVAGSAETRASALRDAWRDDSIAAIVGVRGGYGSAHLLPLLDPEDARRAPKPFVGYSDLTTLLSFLTIRCGVAAFHGPMLVGRLARGAEGYDQTSFLNALCRREPLGELSAPGLETIHGGDASGVLLGGTLTQLVASLGTPFAFNPPAGHVLFVDEVGERPYRLDRMVTQLRQSGLLALASAVVFGELPRCEEPGPAGPAIQAVVADLLDGFAGPVLFGLPSGHTNGACMTLPFGVHARVVTGGEPAVIVEEAAVA